MNMESRLLNLSHMAHMAEIHKLLFEDDESMVPFTDSKQGISTTHTRKSSHGLNDENYDTDASEEIEEREDSSSEHDDMEFDSDSDREDDSDFYVCNRRKGNKTLESFSWKKVPYATNQKTIAAQNVSKKPSEVVKKTKNVNSILDSWQRLFDDAMLDRIVKCTNQYIDSIRKNFVRQRDANATDKTEILALIGLLYIAGIYIGKKINLDELWDSSGFGVEIFRLTMSIKRFRFLLLSLRFDDLESRKQRRQFDKLAPIRDLFEEFVTNCRNSYSVGADVTIGDKLEAFRGKCSFVHYIPFKPARYGIKIFAAVDSRMFYTCNLEIYAGKQPEGPFQVSNSNVDVVKRLISPISHSGSNIIAEKWFSDVSLIQELPEKYGLSFVGELNKNQWQIPKELKKMTNRKMFSSIFAFRNEGTMVSYISQEKTKKKNMILISSIHTNDAIDQSTGHMKKPEMITYYNHHKNVVDVVDKMCLCYNVQRSTKRWSMVIFYSMLNIAGINAQIIHLSNGNEKIQRRSFLRKLGMKLVEAQLLRRTKTPNLPSTIRTRIAELLPGSVDPPSTCSSVDDTSSDIGSRKHCHPCTKSKRRRMTRHTCRQCGVHLCLQHCSYSCIDGCEKGKRIDYSDDDD